MRKTRRRSKAPPAASPPPAAASLLEVDLAVWAGRRVAAGGRRDALLGRVEDLRLSLDGRAIEAHVRGNRPLPYRVDVRASDGSPTTRCTCSRESSGPCRHAVAALETLRFPHPKPAATRGNHRRPSGRSRSGAGRIIQHAAAAPGFVLIGASARVTTRDERIAVVRAEEIAARRQRARAGRAAVRRLDSESGSTVLEVAPRRGEGPGRVILRGAGERWASCTCDDFAANELETCSHIERARTWIARNKTAAPMTGVPTVAVWCRPRTWLDQVPDPLREIRVDLPEGTTGPALARHFDEEGWLRTPPPRRDPVAWAARAVVAARRHARRQGHTWELEASMRDRLREERAARALARGRALAGEDSAEWREIVPGLRLTLHDYQREGALFLAATGRAFLADDMGLGKTAQAVVAALLLRRTAGAARALVVCPASLKHQWSTEIAKTCGESAIVVDGPPAERHAAYSGWRAGFLILNYELVLRDLDAIRAAAIDLVVLDEAQRIKNWSTQTARAVKRLTSPHAFVLTGTPLENRLIELHSLVEFLHPRALGPRWRMFPFHAVTEARGRVIAYEGLDVLRRRLAGFFLRRERREVMDQLPARTDNTFWTGMTAQQRRPYRKHAATAAALAAKHDTLGPAEVRSLYRALTSMRILCNAHAQYAWDETEARLAHLGSAEQVDPRALDSPKLEEFARVIDDLLDESEEKIVVFSQWERMLRLARLVARDSLARRDQRGEILHGGMTSRARVALLDLFRDDPELRVLFSTDAGGQGLNLQHASIVVNLEVPWNPAVIEQRVGRVHRLGQRRSVQVLHFVTRGAIEERVRKVVEDKRALFEGLLVEEVDRVELDAGARSGFLERIRLLLEEPAAAP